MTVQPAEDSVDTAWAAALAALDQTAQVVVHSSNGSGLSFSTAESKCVSLHLPLKVVKQSQLLQELSDATSGRSPLAASVEDFSNWLEFVGAYRPAKCQRLDTAGVLSRSLGLFKVRHLNGSDWLL